MQQNISATKDPSQPTTEKSTEPSIETSTSTTAAAPSEDATSADLKDTSEIRVKSSDTTSELSEKEPSEREKLVLRLEDFSKKNVSSSISHLKTLCFRDFFLSSIFVYEPICKY